MADRLRDEHPVERVSMRARERARPYGILDRDGEPLEALAGYVLGNVERQLIHAG